LREFLSLSSFLAVLKRTRFDVFSKKYQALLKLLLPNDEMRRDRRTGQMTPGRKQERETEQLAGVEKKASIRTCGKVALKQNADMKEGYRPSAQRRWRGKEGKRKAGGE